MNTRATLTGGLGLLVLAALGGGAWWFQPAASPAEAGVVAAEEAPAGDLPIPPVPPRIAEGAEYDRCLAMLGEDPTGAAAFADAWEATGGGEGAVHCRALALISLGKTEAGAELLERLAGSSQAPALARASLYGQADQAWLLAGDASRAFGAATLALTLSSDDPDLLIDRSIASANMERYHDAIDDLSNALDLDPRRADTLVFRAAAWRYLNQFDLAQDDIDRAIAVDPENPEALLERGILRQRRGDRAGARRDWQQAVALAPDTATGDLAQQNLALLEAGPERR